MQGTPTPPPLSLFHVEEAPSFAHTGIDFAGSLHVRDGHYNKKAHVWICMFTRCVVRAVHDELSTALTKVEAVTNSNPSSSVSSEDIKEAFTSSHLLFGQGVMDFPDHLCQEPEHFEAVQDVLTKCARHLEQTQMHFGRDGKESI